MSASDMLPGQMLSPTVSDDGFGHENLNAAYHEQPHGLPDSTADHPLLGGGGPNPDSVDGSGTPNAPDLVTPVG